MAQGICSTLQDLSNSRIWPPTLRQMASGQLQFLMESHDNLLHLGSEWHQQRTWQMLHSGGGGGSGKQGSAGGAFSASGRSKSVGKLSLLSLSGGSAVGAALGVQPGVTRASGASSSPPLSLASLLRRGGGTQPGSSQQQQQLSQQGVAAAAAADPLESAVKAAGSHPGLVPVLSSFVALIKTGHPLLELSGARGIARLCFAGSTGAPSAPALLAQVKAAAAAVGALGALVDLFR